MSIVPAAPFLVEFGSEPPAAIAEEMLHGAIPTVEAGGGDSEQLEEAYARGIEEGKAAAEAEAETRLAEQKAELEQSLAAAREAWCREEGERLVAQLAAAMDQLEERIATAAEQVLRPLLSLAVRDRAVADLRTTLHEMISSNPEIVLEISGPEDLLEAVRASLSGSVAAVSYVTTEGLDVQIKAGGAVIETRIAAWLHEIEGGTLG